MPILQDQQAAASPQGDMPPPNPEILSPIVQAHMAELEQMTALMDPKMAEAYDRVLEAGIKMLYSPDNAEMMEQIILNDDMPVANKLGEGIANLLIMMDNTGNGTIPKEVIVPVGVAIMFEAADYLFELDIEVTEEDLGTALELLIQGVLLGYGMEPDQVEKVIDDMGDKLGFDETEEGKKINALDGKEKTPAPEPEMDEDAAMEAGFNADRGV